MKITGKQTSQENEEVCNCPHCTYDKEVQVQLSKLKPEQRKFFTNLYSSYCEAQYKLEEVLEEQAEEEDHFASLMPETPIMYH